MEVDWVCDVCTVDPPNLCSLSLYERLVPTAGPSFKPLPTVTPLTASVSSSVNAPWVLMGAGQQCCHLLQLLLLLLTVSRNLVDTHMRTQHDTTQHILLCWRGQMHVHQHVLLGHLPLLLSNARPPLPPRQGHSEHNFDDSEGVHLRAHTGTPPPPPPPHPTPRPFPLCPPSPSLPPSPP